MRKARIINTLFTNFTQGEIIDVYSLEEVLASNLSESAREWLNEGEKESIGFFCLSNFNPTDDGTIDFTRFFEGDIELL